ncbi:hypothetical protein SCHPADRAFT_905099 [Schizopora paradoxa]|uniref:Sc15 protein n=1 Tax=Schizopora paradoxa TaxID=27342 RepID=A0A0H2S6M4_9AGAM|nr:hypothetical protein SCHPADRAFT_905099 [Schizopora paradoxa]
MLFARVASFFFAVLTFGLVAFANPVPNAEKRAVDPTTLVTNLQTKINGLTSQLSGITTNSAANEIKAQEVVTQIVTAIQEAQAQSQGGLLKRQTADAVADVLSAIVTDVGTILAPVVVIIPILGPLVTEIDVALNGLVVSLDVVVAGLVDTLDSLLVGVAGILNGLGLTLLLGTLGL